MTENELQAAFDYALTQWAVRNPAIQPHHHLDLRMVRYFFWAGSTFGCEAAAEIYHATYGPDGVPKGEDVEGVGI